VEVGGKIWEVDEFLGAHQGLLLAEIELESEDEAFEMPIWAGKEVTGDARYYNSSLSKQSASR
ncbi:MAG: adenylate cyclase, partial [Paludibacteraceae bacterium]|nr:adenylate cyclase [Paludibacteraceae bacterium]